MWSPDQDRIRLDLMDKMASNSESIVDGILREFE
jgi:hypothetical protein